ncbi:MAG: histidine kinase dimerization/phosphoacceptor domain-containing protein [Gaiellaceae bacterium]
MPRVATSRLGMVIVVENLLIRLRPERRPVRARPRPGRRFGLTTKHLLSPAAGAATNGHSDFAFTTVVVCAGWLVGRGMRGRVRQTTELTERTRLLEQQSEAERAAAAAEERRRIARDLHDVIAHSVSVMVVQAGAAEDIFQREPAGVLEPIRAVQETGRAALIEISRLLGLLRADGRPGRYSTARKPRAVTTR